MHGNGYAFLFLLERADHSSQELNWIWSVVAVIILSAPQTSDSSWVTLSLELGLVCHRAFVSIWVSVSLTFFFCTVPKSGPSLCSFNSSSSIPLLFVTWCLLASSHVNLAQINKCSYLVSFCKCLGLLRFWANLFLCDLSCLMDSAKLWTCSLCGF